MGRTRNFADHIRAQMAADPELARAVKEAQNEDVADAYDRDARRRVVSLWLAAGLGLVLLLVAIVLAA